MSKHKQLTQALTFLSYLYRGVRFIVLCIIVGGGLLLLMSGGIAFYRLLVSM